MLALRPKRKQWPTIKTATKKHQEPEAYKSENDDHTKVKAEAQKPRRIQTEIPHVNDHVLTHLHHSSMHDVNCSTTPRL